MKKQVMNFLSMALMALVLVSCGGSGKKGSGGKSLFTPVSSGVPYEMLVVIDKDMWNVLLVVRFSMCSIQMCRDCHSRSVRSVFPKSSRRNSNVVSVSSVISSMWISSLSIPNLS